MGITYKLLASATTTSTTTSFALTNIPQQYTDLLIEISARSSGTDSIIFYAQPYGYGYAQKGLSGNSSTFTGYNYMGNYGVDYIGTLPSSSDTADVFGTYRIYIPNYSDSTSAKPYSSYGVSESATSTAYHEFTTHYFPSTSPIEAFNIGGNSVAFATGSTISVYGISNVDSSSSPSAPTISQVKAGHSSATVYFTETADTTSYEVTTSPGNSKTYGTKSPIQVKSLSNGTAYTFSVVSQNSFGRSPRSSESSSVTPFVGGYESIASYTIGSGGSSTITFSGISQDYEHLEIRMFNRGTISANTASQYVQFNGDTGNNYAYKAIESNGAGINAFGSATGACYISEYPAANATSYNFGICVFEIPFYSRTDIKKSSRSFSGDIYDGGVPNGHVTVWDQMWDSQSAITSITLVGTLAQHSVVALYGIKGM